MIKKILIIAVLSIVVMHSAAFAQDDMDIIFKDTLYGAAIGAILGGAIYLADDDNFGTKMGTGIAIGAIGGLAYGVYHNSMLVEIENNKVKFAVPTPVIEKTQDGVQYTAGLIKARF